MDNISVKIGEAGNEKQPPRKREDIKQISAKLHPAYDQDLVHMIRQIPKRERSKVYRDAIRFYLRSYGR